MTLWIFGDSNSTPWRVSVAESWPALLTERLQVECVNKSQPGADNFFIYHCFLDNLSKIAKQDIVIIGWSHYSRKSFVLDYNNQTHIQALKNSLHYRTHSKDFLRNNNNTRPDDLNKWLNLKPSNTGNTFYDTWFNDYYSEHEQKCNLQSYTDSVQLRIQERYIPFYFSKDSIAGTDVCPGDTVLEFILANGVALSDTDMHMNAQGHKIWAQTLNHKISCLINTRAKSLEEVS